MTIRRSKVLGCGSYLPDRIVTNAELSDEVGSTDEWIVQRTGICQRHIAAEGQLTSDLGIQAAQRALAAAGVAAEQIDLVIVATTTPDDTFPATATRIQSSIGALRSAAFDVQAVCAGFVFGLAIADSFLKTGLSSMALVIGAETYSRILDWEDRSTCVLFGDGAGAVVLQATEIDEAEHASARGLLSVHLHSDGRYRDILYVDGGPSSTQTVGHLRMTGKEVFRHAVTNLAAVSREAVEAGGFTLADIDWLVPHQANIRILDGVARKLDIDANKVITTVNRHANTSAASIPLALDEAVRDGRIKPGDLVLTQAIGGGLSWGAALIRW
jgi:3-oxoacyl-[acyl-carrier-protein] synthase III